jgi:hypothetical protein
MADEEIEQTLCTIQQCYIYKIPPRKSATGYRAAEWNTDNFLWSGRLVVVSKGEKCLIRLLDKNTNTLFAECVASERTVEPVTDSSRYFVLTLEDNQTGRRAFLGLGFSERSEAFDFNAAMADHKKWLRQQEEAKAMAQKWTSQPRPNLSIPTGQTIHVDIKSKVAKPKAAPSSSSLTTPNNTNTIATTQNVNENDISVLLPPPPSSAQFTSLSPSSSITTAPSARSAIQDSSLWSEFTGPTTTSQSSASTPSGWVTFN